MLDAKLEITRTLSKYRTLRLFEMQTYCQSEHIHMYIEMRGDQVIAMHSYTYMHNYIYHTMMTRELAHNSTALAFLMQSVGTQMIISRKSAGAPSPVRYDKHSYKMQCTETTADKLFMTSSQLHVRTQLRFVRILQGCS